MQRARVRILNSSFVLNPTPNMIGVLRSFLVRMYRYEFRKVPTYTKGGPVVYRNDNQLKDKWIVESPSVNEVRMHISYLNEFRKKFSLFDIDYIIHPTYPGDDVEIEMQDFYSPRGKQGEWVEFLTTAPGPHLALPATMGGGKTVTFLAVAAVVKKRTVAIIPPFLSDRWLLEIGKFTKLNDREYVYISGAKLLKSYMTTIEAGSNPFKIVLLAINTIRNYIRDYYLNPELWVYSPEEFFKKAKFGLKGVDEAHKELHFHFTSNMFLNLGRYVNLSGTLRKENEFLNEMAERIYPLAGRCPVDAPKAITDCIIYKMYYNSNWIPRCKSPMGYSHVLLENDIRYNPSIKRMYFIYLARIVYGEFVAIRSQPNDKCMVFLATTKLADEFIEFLQESDEVSAHFKDVRTGRLRRGEPDSKCHTLDIFATTVGRAGTGFDMPGILTVVNTVAISDGPLQAQVLGRGRERDDVNCRYVRLYSPNIPKHVDYHLKSLTELRSLTNSVAFKELGGSMPVPSPYDKQYAKKIETEERKARKKKGVGKRYVKK